MFLAERFQLLLEEADDVGMIVVDSRFREEDARLRRFFADLTKDGSPYSRLDRIVEGLFLGPSHYSIGLQCADLVCAITAAAERGDGQARGYLKTLLPRFATHPATGALEGVGIKRFPEQVPRPREETRLLEPSRSVRHCVGLSRRAGRERCPAAQRRSGGDGRREPLLENGIVAIRHVAATLEPGHRRGAHPAAICADSARSSSSDRRAYSSGSMSGAM